MFTTLKKSGVAASLALALTVGVVSAAVVPSAYAFDQSSTSVINVDEHKVILKGYDAVAFFTKNAPVKGDQKYSANYEGATYYFSSAENQKTFQANPSHYAPQFGGFCAMGIALGKKLDIDPAQFVVFNEKLYVNVNADIFKRFSQDVAGNVAKGDANWPAVKDKAPSSLN